MVHTPSSLARKCIHFFAPVNSIAKVYLCLFRQPLATQAGLEILKRGGNAAVSCAQMNDFSFNIVASVISNKLIIRHRMRLSLWVSTDSSEMDKSKP
jgi:hypothetical protein